MVVQAGPSASSFLSIASKAVGDPYSWGGASPSTGFDCSGLVQWALTAAGLRNVPRTSEAQWAWVQHIPQSQLQPGDLVFEQWPGDNTAPGHVAIYTGNGRIEEAPQPGQSVHVVPWSPGQVNAEGGRIVGYGRVPGLTYSGAGGGIVTTGIGGGLFSIPSQITGFFTTLGTAVDWLVQPSHWIRIIAAILGLGFTGAGVVILAGVGG